MTKQEFLQSLGEKLSEDLAGDEVLRQMHYYEGYIDAETSRGRREEDVIAELGDPILLARNVMESPAAPMDYRNETSPYEQGFAEGNYASMNPRAAAENSAGTADSRSGADSYGQNSFEGSYADRNARNAADSRTGADSYGQNSFEGSYADRNARNAADSRSGADFYGQDSSKEYNAGGGARVKEANAAENGQPDGFWRREPDPKMPVEAGAWQKMPGPEETLEGDVVTPGQPGLFARLSPLLFAIFIVGAFIVGVVTGMVSLQAMILPLILLVIVLILIFVLVMKKR